ncbi:hypothetical protein MtrunA17_Chr6g0483191 [Medicago truncatula]|uniref:Uncharacterized protein n=1 Tax=Medicago truncatula TaxID=3880 RepID=A0A396HHF8_MEDTR|nr:hypothetical protein MtrunA17_Chr6g0483191 [Medicago truncatula]
MSFPSSNWPGLLIVGSVLARKDDLLQQGQYVVLRAFLAEHACHFQQVCPLLVDYHSFSLSFSASVSFAEHVCLVHLAW